MPQLKVITFTVKDRCFALPSRQVGEIIDSAANVKKLFYSGDALSGVLNYEGDLVSVLNLPFLMGMGDRLDEPMILMCRDKREDLSVGLTISEVIDIQIVDSARVKPNTSSTSPWLQGSIRAPGEGSNKVISLIDLGKLFDYSLKNIDKEEGQAAADANAA